MKKVPTKAALTIVALLAMLMFAAPSFADTITIDFTGGDTASTTHPAAFKVAGSVINANYLPLEIVAVRDLNTGKSWPKLPVSNAYLSYTLDTNLLTGTLDVFSGTDDHLFSAKVSKFTYQKDGLAYNLSNFSGTAQLLDPGSDLLDTIGLTVPAQVPLYFLSHSYITLNNGGQVTFHDNNVALAYTPEPMTAALFLPGLAFLGFVRRRFLA